MIFVTKKLGLYVLVKRPKLTFSNVDIIYILDFQAFVNIGFSIGFYFYISLNFLLNILYYFITFRFSKKFVYVFINSLGPNFLLDVAIWNKEKYSKIDQHLARHFKYNVAYLSSPPPFLYRQIITPFSNSMISTN